MSDVKMWGSAPYGGLGYDFDPQWYLTAVGPMTRRWSPWASSC
jgi:hypothetical protein